MTENTQEQPKHTVETLYTVVEAYLIQADMAAEGLKDTLESNEELIKSFGFKNGAAFKKYVDTVRKDKLRDILELASLYETTYEKMA